MEIAPGNLGYFDQIIFNTNKMAFQSFFCFSEAPLLYWVISKPGLQHCQARSQPGYIISRTVSHTSTGTNQNFIIGCRYFLKKRKLPVRTKTLLFVAGIFLAVIFLFPCDNAVICLCPTYQMMIVLFFILWGLRVVVS